MIIESQHSALAAAIALATQKESCLLYCSAPHQNSGGELGRWTPEHFLVAAAASCLVSTFSGIAEKSRLEFVSFKLDAEGLLDYADGIWRFTEINLRPVVKGPERRRS